MTECENCGKKIDRRFGKYCSIKCKAEHFDKTMKKAIKENSKTADLDDD